MNGRPATNANVSSMIASVTYCRTTRLRDAPMLHIIPMSLRRLSMRTQNVPVMQRNMQSMAKLPNINFCRMVFAAIAYVSVFFLYPSSVSILISLIFS